MSTDLFSKAETTKAPHSVGDGEVQELDRMSALSARYGVDTRETSNDESLDLLAKGTFISKPNRAAFWAGDGSCIVDPNNEAEKPLNEVLIQKFVDHANQELGYQRWRDGHAPEGADLYQTMHSLPEGRALWRITQPAPDRPRLVNYGGQVYRNDTFATTDFLMDSLSNIYSRRASGIITVAANDAEPNTFFRLRELESLSENTNITGVRVIDLQYKSSTADEKELLSEQSASLTNQSFQNRIHGLSTHLFSDVSLWVNWQRDQWLQASLRRLASHLDPEITWEGRIPGLSLEQRSASYNYCLARFHSELYLICTRLDRLGRNGLSDTAEQRRLQHCSELISRFPETLQPLQDPYAVDMFNTVLIKDRIDNIAERDRLWSLFWSNQEASLEFASKQLQELEDKMQHLLQKDQR